MIKNGRPPDPKHGGLRSGSGRKPKSREIAITPAELQGFLSPIMASQLATIAEENFDQLLRKAVSLALHAETKTEVEMLKFVLRLLMPLADFSPGGAGRGGDSILENLQVNIDNRNMGPNSNDGAGGTPIEGVFREVADQLAES